MHNFFSLFSIHDDDDEDGDDDDPLGSIVSLRRWVKDSEMEAMNLIPNRELSDTLLQTVCSNTADHVTDFHLSPILSFWWRFMYFGVG